MDASRRARAYLWSRTIWTAGSCPCCHGKGWFRVRDRRYRDGYRPERHLCPLIDAPVHKPGKAVR